MHPIVVDRIEQPTDDGKLFTLIAGERRLRAFIYNGEQEIPITIFSELDELDRKILECEENMIRQDFDWAEEIEILRQLDELKRKKYGDATQGNRSGEGWTLQDTADAVGIAKGTASQDITLANTLRERPDLAEKVKKMPKHAARKIVKQTLQEEKLKRQIDNKKMIVGIELKHGPCQELIETLEDESIDLWLTDPPFAAQGIVDVSKVSKGSPLYNMTNTNVGTDADMLQIYKKLIPAVYKKLKPGAHIYVFFGHAWYCRLINLLRVVGFEVDDQPLIWYKMRATVMPKDMHYTSSYEAVLFGHKPPVGRILSKPVPNVLSFQPIAPQSRVHPLQRPHDLLKLLIENSTGVGDIVLDTFAGSASTLVSAMKLQRRSIGFELDEGNYLRAQKWISDEFGE
jgi:site-specific DNA-methyltransferase (adenine-specific)